MQQEKYDWPEKLETILILSFALCHRRRSGDHRSPFDIPVELSFLTCGIILAWFARPLIIHSDQDKLQAFFSRTKSLTAITSLRFFENIIDQLSSQMQLKVQRFVYDQVLQFLYHPPSLFLLSSSIGRPCSSSYIDTHVSSGYSSFP